MDYNKIIIALVVLLVVMIAAGAIFLNSGHAKIDSRVIVTSNSTLHDGDNFTVMLTDLNNTPIANQRVDITIIDANGGKNPRVVTTDAKGEGSLQLNGLNPGNYTMNVTYGGNENYTSCNTTQNLEMKKVETQSKVEYTSEKSSSEPYVVGMSDDRCVLYWSDGHTTYRGETGEPITKSQYEYLKTYGKR